MRMAIVIKATTTPNAKQVYEEINNEVGRVSYSTVLKVIKAAGIDLTEAARERMKRQHANPEFAERLAAAASERMKRLHGAINQCDQEEQSDNDGHDDGMIRSGKSRGHNECVADSSRTHQVKPNAVKAACVSQPTP